MIAKHRYGLIALFVAASFALQGCEKKDPGSGGNPGTASRRQPAGQCPL